MEEITCNMSNMSLTNDKITRVIKSKVFVNALYSCFEKYIEFGSRSSKKVDMLYNFIKDEIEKIIPLTYSIQLDQYVKSINSAGKKKCDIVIYKNRLPYIILPVKFIMSNYKQNKNNSWENLTGELMHLKWANKNIKIIPINIIFNSVPYLDKDKKIKKFECIDYDTIFKTMDILQSKYITHDIINYILDVEQVCNVNDNYNICPNIISFNKNTKYRTFKEILSSII